MNLAVERLSLHLYTDFAAVKLSSIDVLHPCLMLLVLGSIYWCDLG